MDVTVSLHGQLEPMHMLPKSEHDQDDDHVFSPQVCCRVSVRALYFYLCFVFAEVFVLVEV